MFLEPWAQTSAPSHLVLWDWTCQPSHMYVGRESLRGSFLAFGLRVPVLAKESERLGTVSTDAAYPVTWGKSVF